MNQGSTERKPVIAITGALTTLGGDKESPLLVVREAYIKLIIAAGGIPVLIPNTTDQSILSSYVSNFDGLLLTGGGDIHPNNYGQEPIKESGANGQDFDLIRDTAELFLVKQFLEKRKPILGICRGSQIINVALKGTLIQNVPKTKIHFTEKANGGWYVLSHELEIVIGTFLHLLASQTNLPKISVNSVHHQAVANIGEGLQVAALSLDGTVEAIESINMLEQFLLGVQWHPEQMPDDPLTKLIMQAFIARSIQAL